MRYAIVQNGLVTNVALADSPLAGNWIEIGPGQSAAPGDSYDDQTGEFSPAPAPVPPVVSRFQARAALHQSGLLDQVEALMSDPQTDPTSRLAWTHATEFRRSSPTIATLAGPLGLSDEQVDDLFRAAAQIEA